MTSREPIGCVQRRTSVWTKTAILGALVILVIAGACSDDDGPETSPPSTHPPGTITAPPGEEIDCGEYTLPSDPALEEIPDDAFPDEHRCFLDALAAGTPAVLVEHGITTEGDPVRQQMRVSGPNQFNLTHDSTLDSFGSQTVYTVACKGAEVEQSRLRATECEDPPD